MGVCWAGGRRGQYTAIVSRINIFELFGQTNQDAKKESARGWFTVPVGSTEKLMSHIQSNVRGCYPGCRRSEMGKMIADI
jgi:hypothetical protein